MVRKTLHLVHAIFWFEDARLQNGFEDVRLQTVSETILFSKFVMGSRSAFSKQFSESPFPDRSM